MSLVMIRAVMLFYIFVVEGDLESQKRHSMRLDLQMFWMLVDMNLFLKHSS